MPMHLRIRRFVVLCATLTSIAIGAQPLSNQQWLAAVTSHLPGSGDEPAKTVAQQPAAQIRQTVTDYVKSLAARKDARANLMLERAALLHTDIARFVPVVVPRAARTAADSTFQLEDGKPVAGAPMSPHWALAEQLLDAVSPSSAADETVRLWYYAIIAHQMSRRQWGVVGPIITHALTVLPHDARILFYSGVEHEAMCAPAVQSLLDDPAMRVNVRVRSSEVELLTAETSFRQAIVEEPGMLEAHLRLGHVLGLLGRDAEAVDALRAVADKIQERTALYYAWLFIGRSEARLGHLDEAHTAFTMASGFFPLAQSPILADSQLQRRREHPAAARAALQPLLSFLPDMAHRQDPWWVYDIFAAREAETLLSQLYAPFLTER